MCVISGLSKVSELGEWDAGRQEKVHTRYSSRYCLPRHGMVELDGSLDLAFQRGIFQFCCNFTPLTFVRVLCFGSSPQ